MEFGTWLEATKDFVEKKVDPALLTFEEFWDSINSQNKWHSDSAYDYPLQKYKGSKSEYPMLVNNQTINGIIFQIRMKREDNYRDNVYAKSDPSGKLLRDESDRLIYYSKEELVALGKHRRYSYSFAVFDKEQEVAHAQDEWGCLLVAVAPEYRRFGLGQILTKLFWEAEPGKDTGGCTSRGAALTKKVHTNFVREYLQSGFYSFLVNQGTLTAERAKAIIASAGLENKTTGRVEKNYGSNDPDNWLLMVYNGTFILYDKLLKDLYQEEDNFWAERCIKAMGDVGPMTNDKSYSLRTLGGDSDPLKRWMVYLCVSWTAEEDDLPLYVYQEDLKYVDEKLMKIEPKEKNGWVSLITQPEDYKGLAMAEKAWRKKFDKYGEFEQVVIEMAYAKYQD